MTSSLSVELLHREGFQSGLIKVTERLSLDFLVDGQSLYTMLMEAYDTPDVMGAFVADRPQANRETQAIFLLRRPDPELMTRVKLFICPECGDLDCGAMTMEITNYGDGYTWQNFAFEGYPGDDLVEHITFPDIGPFTFSAKDYERLMESAPAMIEQRGLVH